MRPILFLTIAILCIGGCDKSVEPDDRYGTIYLNSFESDADTTGWWGYGYFGFYGSAPPEGGDRSLSISGGCIWPHAVFDMEPSNEDRLLMLRCWASPIYGGQVEQDGNISLIVSGEFSESIEIPITENSWAAYQPADTLFCPANHSLSLNLSCGGLVPGSMLVDLLEVVRVK